MGCQSAFYMLYAAGIYPIMGQDLYILTPPLLERTVLPVGGAGRLEISAPGARPGTFIGGVRLDGAALDRLWLRHSEIAEGARLEVELVGSPSDFGTRNLPPAGS
jgi:putative alpha-1,2-mannosidase